MFAFPTIATPPTSRRPRRSTTYAMIGRLQVMATGGADSLGPNDCLLDTAANCSLVRNKTSLHNLHGCQTVIFDGIGGTLAISQKGCLGPFCNAYHHAAATANIISLSSNGESGHLVTYSNKGEYFILDFGKGTRTFNKGTNGLYKCDSHTLRART